jgi:hypothetical protein
MLFKNSVRTSKRTPHFTIAAIYFLTLFKEIKSVYIVRTTQNHQIQNAEEMIVKPAGIYTYHLAFKGQRHIVGGYRGVIMRKDMVVE